MSQTSRTSQVTEPVQKKTGWVFALVGVLLVALTIRLVFFTGYFGSDEVTYTQEAVKISQGVRHASSYIGAVRLGINLPVGFFLWLFGKSEFVANLWSLICSVGEVWLVFLIAYRFWGAGVAALAALTLALVPLHAHFAGRLMADSPLGFFITFSFYALFKGDAARSWPWYLVAGAAAGFVWWIKSAVALVFVLTFLGYLFWERQIASKWFVMACGFTLMVFLNSLIFFFMQGDFWHLFRLTTTGVSEYVQQPGMRTEPSYYFKYLFFDVRHTWLLGPLALLGIYFWLRARGSDPALTKVVIWGIGLVGLFSFLVVSWSPLVLISKQVNYMLIFLAPLALLAGYALSRLPQTVRYGAVFLILVTGMVGTALEQLNIKAFVSNSKATLDFAASIPDRPVYGMTNAVRYSAYRKLFADEPAAVPTIQHVNKLDSDVQAIRALPADARGFSAYVVFDPQTTSWGKPSKYARTADIPACWSQVAELSPEIDGVGFKLAYGIKKTLSLLSYTQGSMRIFDSMLRPKAALVYGISSKCL